MAKQNSFLRSNCSALGWATAVFVASLCSSATAAPVGTQFQINTSGTTQKDPKVAVAPDGSFVVVWEDKTSKNIYARRYGANGTPAGSAFQVNTPSGEHKKPSVSVAADGSFVVVWEKKNSDTDKDVLARRFDAGGNALGAEFMVNTSTGEHKKPSISVAADGSFVVVWEKKNGSNKEIFVRRYDSAGNALSAEVKVNTITGENKKPSIALAADGSFVIIWEQKTGGNLEDVYARKYDSSGNPVGAEFRVNTSSGTAGIENGSPRIAMAANGAFVVVWEREVGSNKDVIARLYDASGNSVSGEFQINTSGGEQKDPSVAMAADGTFVVTWQNKASQDIISRSYNASGTATSGETTVNATSGDLKDPSIGMNPNGQYVIVWGNDSGGDVFGQLFGSAAQKRIILWREVPNAA